MKDFIETAIRNSNQSILIFTNHLKDEIISPRIVYANCKFLNEVEYDLDNLMGKNPIELLNETCSSKNIGHIVDTITGENKQQWEGALEVITKNGHSKIFFIKIIPVRNFDDNTMYYACFGESITEYHSRCQNDHINDEKLESFVNGLIEEVNVFRGFADILPQGVWRSKLHGDFTYLNCMMFNHFRVEKDGNLFDIIGEPIEFLSNMSYKKITFKNKNIDQWIKCSIWPIEQDGVTVGYCGTFKDVSEDYKILDELKQMQHLNKENIVE